MLSGALTIAYHFHGGPLADEVRLVPTYRDRSADKKRYEDVPPTTVNIEPDGGFYRTDGRCCERRHDAGWWSAL